MDDIPLDKSTGISAFIHTHLNLLVRAQYRVILVVLHRESVEKSEFHRFCQVGNTDWEDLSTKLVDVQYLMMETPLASRQLVKNILKSLISPIQYSHPWITLNLLAQFRQIVENVQPDIIWAEHRYPALLANLSGYAAMTVYSHHDWEYRLMRYRPTQNPSFKRTARIAHSSFILRKVEHQLVQSCLGCVSGSNTELIEISELNVNSAYLPTCYEIVESPAHTEVNTTPRIVHFGSMSATANRVGLERFLTITLPALREICSDAPELWIVGSVSNAHPKLEQLIAESGAVCAGFVENLSDVFNPYDIQVIPWEHDTGTRTRVAMLLNYRQVIVAHHNSVRGIKELVHGQNVIMVNDLKEMAHEIKMLIDQPDKRKELADNGRLTFEKSFTLDAMQPRFKEYLARLNLP